MPLKPLYECVIENAINAAVNDPRFMPMTIDELDKVKIEISVLTLPKRLEYRDANDLLAKLKPMRDGVILKKGLYQATFLPEVWKELPNKELFLTHLCLKAGLSGDCWKHNPEIYIYHAIVFEEKDK